MIPVPFIWIGLVAAASAAEYGVNRLAAREPGLIKLRGLIPEKGARIRPLRERADAPRLVEYDPAAPAPAERKRERKTALPRSGARREIGHRREVQRARKEGPQRKTAVKATTGPLLPGLVDPTSGTAYGSAPPMLLSGEFSGVGPSVPEALSLEAAYLRQAPRLNEVKAAWPGVASLYDWLASRGVKLVTDPEPYGLRMDLQGEDSRYFETAEDALALSEGIALRFSPLMFTSLSPAQPSGEDRERVHVDSQGVWWAWNPADSHFETVPILELEQIESKAFMGLPPELMDIGLSLGDSDRILKALVVLSGPNATPGVNPNGPSAEDSQIIASLFPPLTE